MKSLIAASVLLAFASPAFAENTICTGRVRVDVVTDNDGLLAKGDKMIHVGDCGVILDDRMLRTCPKGSFCRVEGTYGGADESFDVVSVKRVWPYREGVRDYREGLCFRARPYIDGSEIQKLWIKGYEAHPTRKQTRHMDEICFPGRIH